LSRPRVHRVQGGGKGLFLGSKLTAVADSFQGEWQANGLESTTVFANIDLQEGEWFDYDEKAGEEVSIKDVKWEIRRA
jgi:hypothetical protein